ncbi:MAG: HutD family protein [Synergistaceae bacterium]|nr:HutD family protein [Synergistaceae bacterium]
MRHLTARDFQVSTWSGGRTIQIAISPEGAVYADRDFLWRVSSATVELEESDFTALSDYDRWILPLSGPIRLSHNGGAEINLAPNEAHFFDGAERTHCRGRCTDFNLMLRKGRCRGRIRALAEDAELNREGVKILYCVKGTVTVNGLALKEYEAVRLEDGESGTVRIASHGHAVLAEVQEA